MNFLLVALAFLAVAHANPFDNLDWSTVKERDIRIPLPPGWERLSQGRIVGGDEAVPNSIPYQVAILIAASGGTFFCGGSLISQRFVMTAAHCVEGGLQIEVRLGAHFVNVVEPGQVRAIAANFTLHPQWNSATLVNDIAIIDLGVEVELNENIQPVALPTWGDASNTFSGSNSRISGWGLDSDSATAISPVLREVFVNVIANLLCNIQFLGMIQGTHICTSGSGGRGACSGDSGGPLVVGQTQVGVVSFGLGLGCELGWPSAFTRVTSFLSFIQANSDVVIQN